MPTVNIRQAKSRLSSLIKKAYEGEEVIITRGLKPVARLVAIPQAQKKRMPGSMKGTFIVGPEFFEPLPEDELEAWYPSDDSPDTEKS